MELQMLLTAIIAFCAVFTSLGLMFNILLRPVKVNQAHMESKIQNVESRLQNLESRVQNLESDMKEVKVDIAEIKSKLDQLLARA